MIDFSATHFDGTRSAGLRVRVTCDGATVVVRSEGGETLAEAPLGACQVSAPLGRTPRTLRLPGGGACEADDGEAWRALERLRGTNRGLRLVHALESRWKAVVASLAGVALGAAAVVHWGIPAAAEWGAAALPAAVSEGLGRQALAALDGTFFEPSGLDPERADAVQALFGQVAGDAAPGRPYRLELRRSPALGPNAFALPGGLVVVTDALVDLSAADPELAGVFAHEIAHGEARHAVRTTLQDAGVFLLVSAVLGDVVSLSSAAAALPALLVRKGYSRDFEREADEAAGRYLLGTAGTTGPLQALLARLEAGRPDFPGASLLSTHPGGAERLARLHAMDAQAGKLGR